MLIVFGGGGWFAYERGWLPFVDSFLLNDSVAESVATTEHDGATEQNESTLAEETNEENDSKVAAVDPPQPSAVAAEKPETRQEDPPPQNPVADQKRNVPVQPSQEPEQVRTFQKHDDHVLCVNFSPDGHRIVSGSRDKSVRVWNADTGQQIWSWNGVTEWVLNVRFSPDGSRVFACAKNRCAILDAGTGRLIDSFETAQSDVMALSGDCTLLAAIQSDKKGTVFDINRRMALHRISSPSVVSGAAFSPDKSYLMLGWERLHRLKLANGEFTRVFIKTEDWGSYIIGMQYSPDGSLLATGSHKRWTADRGTMMGDRMVRIWNASTGKLVRELSGHREWINAVSFTPDGTRLLSAGGGNPEDWGGFGSSGDRSLWLWEVSSGRVLHTFRGHKGAVMSLDVSPDNQYAVSGSCDGTLILWRLPQ